MCAAEVLGLRAEEVRPSIADTDSNGFTDVTGGSRTTFATGLAAYEAAQDAVRQLKERAAKLWEIAPEDVDWIDGKAVSKKNGVPPMTLKDSSEDQFRRESFECRSASAQILGRGFLGPPTQVLLTDTHTLSLSLVRERASERASRQLLLALRLENRRRLQFLPKVGLKSLNRRSSFHGPEFTSWR